LVKYYSSCDVSTKTLQSSNVLLPQKSKLINSEPFSLLKVKMVQSKIVNVDDKIRQFDSKFSAVLSGEQK
jgi:hypothetical protein